MRFRTSMLFIAVAVVVAAVAAWAWRVPADPIVVEHDAPRSMEDERAPTPSPTQAPFRILVVPGHDTADGGGWFLGVYERDVAVDVAQDIASLVSTSADVSVMLARDKTSWNPLLADYFSLHEADIMAFKDAHRQAEQALIAAGEKKVVPDIAYHKEVDHKTAVELYGINKWVNENAVDLVVHIHFNDSGRSNYNLPGPYHGFSLYVPESQLPNASLSWAIAKPVFAELKRILTPEVGSIVGDQSLIAVGASGTLTKPAMLIEYGYIYEKPLRDAASRAVAVAQMARFTVAGIRDYLAAHPPRRAW
jgi:N-acetylmuramoyl-L-alanine amidase